MSALPRRGNRAPVAYWHVWLPSALGGMLVGTLTWVALLIVTFFDLRKQSTPFDYGWDIPLTVVTAVLTAVPWLPFYLLAGIVVGAAVGLLGTAVIAVDRRRARG